MGKITFTDEALMKPGDNGEGDLLFNKDKFNNGRLPENYVDASYELGEAYDGPLRMDEVKKLVAAEWAALSPEEKEQAIRGAKVGDATLFTKTFIDNFLPFPYFSSGLKEQNPAAYEAMQRAIKANPGLAASAEYAGTITGLVGGPFAVAKMVKVGLRIALGKGAIASGGKRVEDLKDLAKILKKEVSQLKAGDLFKIPGATAAEMRNINKFITKLKNADIKASNDLRSYIGTLDSAPKWKRRDLITAYLLKLPPGSQVKKVVGKDLDWYATNWDKVPVAPIASGGGNSVAAYIKAGGRMAKHLVDSMKASWKGVIVDLFAVAGTEASLDYMYMLSDMQKKGYSEEKAAAIALKYMLDKTWQDVAADVILGRLKRFPNLATILGRSSLLAFDLDLSDTGTVDEEKYIGETKDNALLNDIVPGGYNTGGNVRKPTRRGIFRRR